MNVILGIDIGGTTTKIVGFDQNKTLISKLQVKADDQITSLYGAIGNFLSANNIILTDIEKIIITGVGASFISGDIYQIPTVKIEEFEAIGLGGLALANKDEALIVSMGTGTAYVRASKEKILHLGGSGIGGGTLIGLSEAFFHKRNFKSIINMAEKGNVLNVDLTISDISKNVLHTLPADLTASNFGKVKHTASDEDIAAGLINMILETIGMLAVFVCKNDTINDVILTGSLTALPQAEKVFGTITKLHGIKFVIPQNAVYATAIGAALYEFNN